MTVTATTAIFNIVDDIRSTQRNRQQMSERARAVSIKPLAQAKGNGTMSILQDGLSGGRIRLTI